MVPRLIGLYSPEPQSGKSTTAHILNRLHGHATASYAMPLKRMVADLMTSAGLSPAEVGSYMHERKEEVIPVLGVSFRYLCQTLGTEWGRKLIDNDLWVKVAVNDNLPTYTVFDDVRFKNEADALRAKGGVVWKIVRPNATVQTEHVSEGLLEDYPFDAVIVNDGSYEDLQRQIAALTGQ